MKKRTWILIADGARARMLLNEGPGSGLKPAIDTECEADHRRRCEIGGDRPGRVHENADTIGHAYAPRVDGHEFDARVPMAPPKTLGVLRVSPGKGSRAKVGAEPGKDLVNLPLHDLPSRLVEALRR